MADVIAKTPLEWTEEKIASLLAEREQHYRELPALREAMAAKEQRLSFLSGALAGLQGVKDEIMNAAALVPPKEG
jgi:hypothetical protein